MNDAREKKPGKVRLANDISNPPILDFFSQFIEKVAPINWELFRTTPQFLGYSKLVYLGSVSNQSEKYYFII